MIESFRRVNGETIHGELIYVDDEASFDYRPKSQHLIRPEEELTLVIAKTLQMLVKMPEGRLLYVFGYMPRGALKQKSLRPPIMSVGAVYLAEPSENESGMGYDTTLSDAVPYYDPTSGWICIGDTQAQNAILIADDIAISLTQDKLSTVWLRQSL